MPNSRSLFTFTSLAFLMGSSFAHADALQDLKSALEKLNSPEPVTAVYEREFTEVSDADDEDDRRERTGKVTVLISDGANGLQVTYSQDVLDKIELETQLKAEDEDADTPTLNAVGGISATQISRLLSSSNSLKRTIEKATFIGEEPHKYNDKDMRLLSFSLPLEALITDKKARGYVNKFEGTYRVLIDEHGIPLETRTEFKGKGRAFVVLSVTAEGSEFSQYQVVKGRLVRTKHEYSNAYSSTFGDNESSGLNTLKIREAQPTTQLAATQFAF